MPLSKVRNVEVIPGYRLLEPLGSGGFGEVWKCEAPGGLFKAIKFVYGNGNSLDVSSLHAEEELQAIQRVKAIRHPFILSMDRVELIEGDLVIVMELADHSLHDVLAEHRQAGRPGIPRAELLGYLREAAEALDLMNTQYDLQHLDIKPRNLFLVSRHVKVADFGLVNSLGGRNNGQGPLLQLGAITPLYAAPEAFTGALSRHCDQYSLAIVYQELLTGTLPFTGRNSRQLMLQHAQAEPDLSALPACEQPLIARALAKDPARRFESCTALVHALEDASAEGGVRSEERRPARLSPHSSLPPLHSPPAPPEQAETAHQSSAAATVVMTPTTRRGPGVAVPGYRFLERLASNPVSEVWKAQGPDGRPRRLQLLYGFVGPGPQHEAAALNRLTSLSHPGLVATEVVQHTPGRLILVGDLIETSLRERFQECQAQGLPGIPRRELLAHLHAAARTLDDHARQGLHHLALNPRNLLLAAGRLLLADFGPAQLLWLPAGQPVAQLNARYAAPELFEGLATSGSDQYSLALIYQEMLTGVHPSRGQARRGPSRAKPRPDLTPLPASDRDILARALEDDPQQRWDTCTSLVRALEGADRPEDSPADTPLLVPALDTTAPASPSLGQVITELLAGAGKAPPENANHPGGTPLQDVLEHRYVVRLPPGVVRLKLDQFRQQWSGQLLRDTDDLYAFQVIRSLTLWQRCTGRQAGLEVRMPIQPATGASGATEVSLQVKPFGCGKEQGAQLLRAIGPLLLDSARACLQATNERRIRERVPWPHPLRVRFVLPDQSLGEPIDGRGKDISLTGIGFYLPPELPTRKVSLDLTVPGQPEAITLAASIVRVQRCADDWYEVGAVFS